MAVIDAPEPAVVVVGEAGAAVDIQLQPVYSIVKELLIAVST